MLEDNIIEKLQKAIELQDKGQIQQSESLLKEVLIEDPDNDNALFLLGIISHQKNDPLSKELIQKAININPKDIYLSFFSSIFYVENSFEKAAECYRLSFESNPSNPEVMLILGEIYILLNKYDSAISFLLKYIDVNPEDAAALDNVGNIYRKTGSIQLAISFHQKALKYAFATAQTYYHLSWSGL